jgi:hypothetical protein
MNDRWWTRFLLVVLCLFHIRVADGQVTTDPWYGRSPRANDFQAFNPPTAPYSIELPENWQIVPGYSQIILTATEKTRNNRSVAAIVLEHIQLRSALAVSAAVAEVELTSIREREPASRDFAHQIKNVGGRQFLFIQYTRSGHTGPDRVTQYSIFAGTVLYRVICIVSEKELAKYQPIFAHAAASFNVNVPASK